jgi:hypothetical protein
MMSARMGRFKRESKENSFPRYLPAERFATPGSQKGASPPSPLSSLSFSLVLARTFQQVNYW